ncbi:MAG TPA: hypothetical protein VGX68_09860 [Thermoanaerobaculia bacterium]|jgi:hypothetical protein|nr:hypothetical protein [Thermoanaerobaculia bacterium]
MRPILILLTATALAAPAASQTTPPCPLHAEHQKAAAAESLDQRGDKVMGFEHSRTTHHFLLAQDGGAIAVEANDPGDAEGVTQIRAHLSQVAEAFSKGDFAMPGEIHGRTLPGIPEMIRLKDAISYRYEETARGGRVRITAADPAALDAVHSFLRAQIEDHRTGDPAAPSP